MNEGLGELKCRRHFVHRNRTIQVPEMDGICYTESVTPCHIGWMDGSGRLNNEYRRNGWNSLYGILHGPHGGAYRIYL